MAYGPQENDAEETLNSFYTNLSVQLEVAFLNGDSVVLLGDFNAKLGNGIINQDAHAMSKSGKILFSLFQKYNLCLLNSSDICQGTFTRIHECNKRIETSVLDYVFVSDDLQQHVVSMVIDEEKQFTPWRKLKASKRFSDHCAIRFQVNNTIFTKEHYTKRIEVWNFNDPKGWEKFHSLTDSLNLNKPLWKTNDHVELSYQSWKGELESILHQCFKKKRIVHTQHVYNKEIRILIKQRKKLKSQLKKSSIASSYYHWLPKQIELLDQLIDKKISDFNINIIRSFITDGGVINKQNFWKLKKAIAPFSKETPCALLNKQDILLTDPAAIRNEYYSEFKHRLRTRVIKPGLEWYESFHKDICQLRLKFAKGNSSPDFTLHELHELKTGKCTDPTGMVREIFKRSANGLIISVLDMVNSIKRSKIFPLEWSEIWIRTLKKKRGSFRKLENYRDIFLVPILSIIFEKLLKNRISQHLQQNMSRFQSGGMKGKSVVDNLFITRGLINHAAYLNKELWITFYDIEKCFDSLWLEDCTIHSGIWE